MSDQTLLLATAATGAAPAQAGSRAGAPLRVHHVVLSLEPGGLENGVVNVVNGLDPQFFESSVCCLKHAGEFAKRVDPRAAIHEMGWRGGNDWRLVRRMARLFRDSGAQVVHTRNVEAFFYGFAAAKWAGVRTVVHSEHGRSFNDRRLRFVAQRLMTRYTDAVFAVSEQLRSDLVRHVGIPASSIEVLYNGVDLERFGGARDDRGAQRAALGIAADAFVIGTIGRLAPVKNQALLIRALAQSRLAAQVVIVGDGAEMPSLRVLASSLGIANQVHLLGHRNDVSRLLPVFDVFALPSTNEGMSNTILEAMAAGIAPVVSDVGGNPEIVRDGIDGLVFASGDEMALAKHLQALHAEPGLRAQFALAARARVIESFDICAMVRRYEDLYRRASTR